MKKLLLTLLTLMVSVAMNAERVSKQEALMKAVSLCQASSSEKQRLSPVPQSPTKVNHSISSMQRTTEVLSSSQVTAA